MWKIIDNYDWENIYDSFDWIRDMEGVPQDHIHHQEGDVLVHTRMVTEALIGLPEYQRLTEQDQHILFASALLHDVEKRSTTVLEDNGRITSKGHAKKGEFTARTILYTEIETPFRIREAIAKLVRHHGLPLWIFEKEDPAKAAIAASLEVNTELLVLLAKADVLGRTCDDQKELLYRIDLFTELCKDNDCWGKPKEFSSSFARYFYLNRKETAVDYIPFDDTKFEVIMMSAIPGSGKDTYILEHYRDWPVVSLDNIRRKYGIDPRDTNANGKVIQEAKEQAKEYMRKRKSFVWNATNITKALREQVIDLFTSYGGKVKIVYIEVPYRQLVKQNSNREHVVRSNVLVRMIRKLEVPSPWEAHEVEYVVE